MTDWTLPREGGCRCGHVRFRINAQPLLTMACHCTGCQRMSASAFSLSTAVPTDGFAVTSGQTVLGGLRGEQRHHFCPQCLSWLFTRTDGMDWFVNVRSTMLDDTAGTEPFVETWTREKLGWASTPAVHRYGALPELSEYENLMRQFARRDGPARA